MERRARYSRLAISLAIIGLAVFGLLNRQWLIDQYTVWQYSPSAEIAAITERARLSNEAEFYFYASQPKLSDRQEFNAQCKHHEPETVTLGCYTGKIYVYDIDDKRLDGIKEVTAAHEMLHAAYDRLGESKRQEIVLLLRKQAAAIADKAFKDRFSVYAKESQEVQDNELHSILATEIVELSPELEAYYQKYFTDRQALVGLFKQYESVITNLKKTQDRLVAEINSLVDKINSETRTYNVASAALSADVEAFNARAEQPQGFKTMAEFTAARSELIARQHALSMRYDTMQQWLRDHQRLQKQLEDLNVQAQSLQRSLDSTITPVPSV